MRWAFRVLATIDVMLLAAAFLYHSPGEDPAGAGLRLGFAVAFALGLAIVLAIYRVVHVHWVRVAMLGLLAVPLLLIGYGILLSL